MDCLEKILYTLVRLQDNSPANHTTDLRLCFNVPLINTPMCTKSQKFIVLILVCDRFNFYQIIFRKNN